MRQNGNLNDNSGMTIPVATIRNTEDDARSCMLTQSVSSDFILVLTEGHVQYLWPTSSEGPMIFPSFRLSVTVCILLMFVVTGVNQSAAQQATAQLMGTVTDSSGAVVSDAKISLTNSGTNTTRTTMTGKDGGYS